MYINHILFAKSNDFDGLTRGTPPDVGAFESTGGPTSVGENREVEKTELKNYMLDSYPNPFNSTTMIQYGLPSSGEGQKVVLKVYDTLGRLVSTLVNDNLSSSIHKIEFNAS